MKVLVCGGRNFDNYDLLKTVLSALHVTRGITTLIHGAAHGTDRAGRDYAEAALATLTKGDWKIVIHPPEDAHT